MKIFSPSQTYKLAPNFSLNMLFLVWQNWTGSVTYIWQLPQQASILLPVKNELQSLRLSVLNSDFHYIITLQTQDLELQHLSQPCT